jgi:hypothetical protein
MAAEILCPSSKCLFAKLRLSGVTVARKSGDLAGDFKILYNILHASLFLFYY